MTCESYEDREVQERFKKDLMEVLKVKNIHLTEGSLDEFCFLNSNTFLCTT